MITVICCTISMIESFKISTKYGRNNLWYKQIIHFELVGKKFHINMFTIYLRMIIVFSFPFRHTLLALTYKQHFLFSSYLFNYFQLALSFRWGNKQNFLLLFVIQFLVFFFYVLCLRVLLFVVLFFFLVALFFLQSFIFYHLQLFIFLPCSKMSRSFIYCSIYSIYGAQLK